MVKGEGNNNCTKASH